MPAEIIGRDEVRQWTAAGAALVEVLPEKEYREAHLPGAVNLPLKTLDAAAAARLREQARIIVYCYDSQ
ncbi:MAG TPA: rhodanese-like domain-containing protein [Candidatus Binatia bacterium]